jgi:hypothetical protein
LGKRKNSAALFELISKGKQSKVEQDVSVPGWMKDDPNSAGVGQESAEPETGGTVAIRPTAEKVFSTVGGRLRLSLSYMSASLLIVGVIVLLAVTFWLGQFSAGYVTASADDAAALADDVLSAGRQETLLAQPTREVGKYYMVIQDLQRSANPLEEGQRIVEFLAGREEAAEVIEYGDRYVVWSFEAFDTTTGPGIEKYALWIEKIGDLYFEKHETHSFRQRRRDGRLDPLMLRAERGE